MPINIQVGSVLLIDEIKNALSCSMIILHKYDYRVCKYNTNTVRDMFFNSCNSYGRRIPHLLCTYKNTFQHALYQNVSYNIYTFFYCLPFSISSASLHEPFRLFSLKV